jgi:hypothetical protein
MDARAVDAAAARLRELRAEEWENLGLGALALGVAVAATRFRPSLAVPLFVGGLAVGVLGVRALFRRWDLVERLSGERDAYAIGEVLAYASREATLEHRRGLAALVRARLADPGPGFEPRVADAAEELEALAAELEDPSLALDPACAVACTRLFGDPERSPLLNPALPGDELRGRVLRIRAGFAPAWRAA